MNNEELIFEFESGESVMHERFTLSKERIADMGAESLQDKELEAYFSSVSSFILMVLDAYDKVGKGFLDSADIEELARMNRELYSDILPENYDRSYGNPAYACKMLGDDLGQVLSALYFEIRSMIGYAFEGNIFDLVIRMELFLEVYGICRSYDESGRRPSRSEIVSSMYYFYSDYAEDSRRERFAQIVDPDESFMRDIIVNSDLSDLRYLYRFGEYITDTELRTAEHFASLQQEDIDKLAFTFTEGYRVGFAATGKDITIKKTASIIYQLGFERIVKKAVENFRQMGLESTIYRAVMSGFHMNGSARRNGVYGAVPNKQFDYDHKEDEALFLDGALVNRKIEAIKAAGEKYRDKAKLFGGPAVIEVFGEVPFSPSSQDKAISYSPQQKKMVSDYKIKASLTQNEYIIGKERSFTIISFPVPDIGEQFKDIFDETVRINTLDYKLYQRIQQKIIDVLDSAVYVEVEGMGDNRTNMKVMLHKLTDSAKQTNFENCVADVNIPVGEVFTSPVLTGTEGTLHVSGVYLEGLFFKDLELKFKDGFVTDYSCSNFDTDKENRKYIEGNILFNHKSLPIGEFAIGTNTLAYVVARKYNIEDKLPILIAEKTGPHFAVGDTCYSYEEDNLTYNPDGKAIIARDNEVSILRKNDPGKAYFSCHTDITLPYDELGEIRAVREDGSFTSIIKNGRFVLEGCEELNLPLDGKM